MNVSKMNDAFHRDTAEKYEPETDIFCAICGYGIYRGDRVAWDKHDEICHAECEEKEKAMDIATPDKSSAWDWTAREMREYCAARVSAQGGDCVGENAKSCLLYGMCGECPDQWKGDGG